MAYTKSELFTTEFQNCSIFFKALAHPARLAILKYLAETKKCITGDLTDEIPLGRTTINQHLAELRDAGLIQGITEGSKKCYCLDPAKIDELKKATEKFFKDIDIPIDFVCK